MSFSYELLALRFRKLVFAFSHEFSRLLLLRYRILAASEHHAVINFGFDVVVDVGANRGQFAGAVRSLSPQTGIYSFEPLPEAFAVLSKGLGGEANVSCFEFALGESSSRARINISGKDDSSSLLPISSLQNALYPGTASVGSLDISVRRLDEVLVAANLQGRSLLKIDTQGFELSVLKGCGELLREFSFIYCECSFVELYGGQALAGEVIGFLSDQGFDLLGVYNPAFDAQGRSVQSDLLFKRR